MLFTVVKTDGGNVVAEATVEASTGQEALRFFDGTTDGPVDAFTDESDRPVASGYVLDGVVSPL